MQSAVSLKLWLVLVLCLPAHKIMSQCSSYPVPFEQRISKAVYIVQGKVTEKHCYIDAATGFVNTLNKFHVAAWLKNFNSAEDIYIITLGGVYGDRAMEVHPALQLDMQHEYLLMLEADNLKIDDKQFRLQNPQTLQLLNYADAQGSLTNENNYYHDLHYRTPKTETAVFEQIKDLTGQIATKPSGERFIPRAVIEPINNGVADITGFSPATINSGTILAADQVTISGTGFGATAGTVSFTNADDGGATFTSGGVASDIVSWSNTAIVVKPPTGAGTGPIKVNGTFTSASSLNVPYSHLNVYSTFNGFGILTRQRYYLKNKNALGGYTFTFNTNFAANTAAKLAFQRSVWYWRCNTLINWRVNTTSTSAITAANYDGVNLVVFDASLPVGDLSRTITYIYGTNGSGACNLHNTVWWADEMDIQFAADPPLAGFAWQYGPSLPGLLEYDFESVASHELGHLHGAGHVMDAGDIMYFLLLNGEHRRFFNANNIAMGYAKMSYSTGVTCTEPALGPMISLSPGNCSLPVELVNFSGERKTSSTNRLNWSTAQEVNNRGFYVERSADAVSFNEIAFIPGAGTSTQPLSYEFMDTRAGLYPWYYRLRQVDINSQEKISKTVFIDGVDIGIAKVWANEAGNKVLVYLKQGNANANSLQIINSLGQPVLRKQVVPGFSETEVAQLPKGIYYYQLHYQNKIISGKLLLGSR